VHQEKHVMKKNLLLIAAVAIMLAGCIVVPGRPMYVRAPGVVVY
jgi:starvation-inducible outer membrane lipoprotein